MSFQQTGTSGTRGPSTPPLLKAPTSNSQVTLDWSLTPADSSVAQPRACRGIGPCATIGQCGVQPGGIMEWQLVQPLHTYSEPSHELPVQSGSR